VKCPLCGCKVTYEGLNTVECEGSEVELWLRAREREHDAQCPVACPNYRASTPKPPQEPTPYFEDGFGWYAGPFAMTNAAPAVPGIPGSRNAAPAVPGIPGSRNWAKYWAAAGRKLEVRNVPVVGAQGPSSPWFPAAGSPDDPNYDDYPPFTTEWRFAP
jgi:hypothetical protein